MRDLRSNLAQLLERGGPALVPLETRELVIYGAGSCGRGVAAAARAEGLKIRSFIDARAASLPPIDGVPCHLPESPEARAAAAAGIPVVVGVFNYATNLKPILALLCEIGFSRIVSFYEIHEQFGYKPEFWLGDRAFYAGREVEIFAGFDLFEDETSRRIYYEQVALRLTFDTSLLAQPDQANHYFPADLPAPHLPLRFIDGGAFHGDTIGMLLAKGWEIEALAAFEPDQENFGQLVQRVAGAKESFKEAILFPCGLSNETAIRSFASGAGASSTLQAQGDTHIQVVALDDVLPTFAPNFIKLDIEGAEPDALAGAAGTISRFRPTLAVSVYHAPEHLWTLPQQMQELQPGCRLALRQHQFNGFDLVAYAFSS